MSTSRKTVESLGRALALVPEVSFLPMRGEYCVYSRGRLFAMVCGDELFLKTSPETLCLFRDTATRAYCGGPDMCKANAEWLEDPEKLGEAVLYTLAGQFRQRRSPMLYLIDHEGYVRRSYSPSSKDREKISSDLEGLLREVSPGR